MNAEELRQQLAQLPLCAIMAFMARLARSVQPLTNVLPAVSRGWTDRAIADVEAVALGYDVPRIFRSQEDAEQAAEQATGWPALASRVAVAAARAAKSAIHSAKSARWFPDRAAKAAAAVVEEATAAAVAVSSAGDVSWAAPEIQRLIALRLGEPGTPGFPIDSSDAGPLGPIGRVSPVW
jgi:hypothetical protein